METLEKNGNNTSNEYGERVHTQRNTTAIIKNSGYTGPK
jgi:hypothetical protein